MKPVFDQEFEIRPAPIIRAPLGVVRRAMTGLAAFRQRLDPDQLPARLRRDAGLDELDIERRRLAKAPLIR